MICGNNDVSVQPYAHPQQMEVFKHLVYVCHGYGMQFERFYSLIHSVVAWFAHLHHLGFQPYLPIFWGKCLLW